MLVKAKLKYFLEKNQGVENAYLSNVVRGWMLWQASRDKFWYFFCLHWLRHLENNEVPLTNDEG